MVYNEGKQGQDEVKTKMSNSIQWYSASAMKMRIGPPLLLLKGLCGLLRNGVVDQLVPCMLVIRSALNSP